MNTTVQNISVQNNTAASGQTMLRDGGFIFVKIVSHNGGENYTLSLGGKNFEATAKTPLQPGTLLRVQVQSTNGTINLVPENLVHSPANESATGIYKLNAPLLEQGQLQGQLAATFAALGLPADSVSLRLLALLQQMGFKADAQLLEKCRKIAKAFSGKEEAASEAALMLSEKGIEPSEENVTALLNTLLCTYSEKDFSAFAKEDRSQKPQTNDDTDSELFCKLYGKPLKNLSNQPGLLTLSNHLASGKLHWIILPFVLESEKNNISGTIRVLLNLEDKKTEKICIFLQLSALTCKFMLYYDYNKVSKIIFSAEPDLSENVSQRWIKGLSEYFAGVPVEYALIHGDLFFWDEDFPCISSVCMEV